MNASSFVQLVDFTTDRPDEVHRLIGEWLTATKGRRTVTAATVCAVGQEPGRYISIVEFPTEEDARVNSGLPETDALARQLAETCERISYIDLHTYECLLVG
ncbi:MAG: hypothetical protein ACRD2W_15420 [Acidimicrobiales bacterium]